MQRIKDSCNGDNSILRLCGGSTWLGTCENSCTYFSTPKPIYCFCHCSCPTTGNGSSLDAVPPRWGVASFSCDGWSTSIRCIQPFHRGGGRTYFSRAAWRMGNAISRDSYPLGTRRRIREWSGRMGVEPYAAGKENFMNHLEAFKQHRPLLFSIAYRMLGSVTDAEDLIQETFLRWQQASKTEVRSPKAYLSRIITRLCIDYLRSARLQREQYVGSWLPEPIIT